MRFSRCLKEKIFPILLEASLVWPVIKNEGGLITVDSIHSPYFKQQNISGRHQQEFCWWVDKTIFMTDKIYRFCSSISTTYLLISETLDIKCITCTITFDILKAFPKVSYMFATANQQLWNLIKAIKSLMPLKYIVIAQASEIHEKECSFFERPLGINFTSDFRCHSYIQHIAKDNRKILW